MEMIRCTSVSDLLGVVLTVPLPPQPATSNVTRIALADILIMYSPVALSVHRWWAERARPR
jgi:hypothetical protein